MRQRVATAVRAVAGQAGERLQRGGRPGQRAQRVVGEVRGGRPCGGVGDGVEVHAEPPCGSAWQLRSGPWPGRPASDSSGEGVRGSAPSGWWAKCGAAAHAEASGTVSRSTPRRINSWTRQARSSFEEGSANAAARSAGRWPDAGSGAAGRAESGAAVSSRSACRTFSAPGRAARRRTRWSKALR
ncbi:hypothetical protein CG736_03715 [Kitasatospora sp. CB02891]|nr:hypothetical protein CG736_03715 [Kitasatospora sp. CB02891]